MPLFKPLNLFNVFIVQCQNVATVKVTDSKQIKVAGNLQTAISYITFCNILMIFHQRKLSILKI